MGGQRFHKTVFELTVLSERPCPDVPLCPILDEIETGDASGEVHVVSAETLDGRQAATALQAQGSDPAFFGLTADGRDLDADKSDEADICAHCEQPIDPACAGHKAFCGQRVHDDECLHAHVISCEMCQALENAWDREHGWKETWVPCSECQQTVCRKHSPDVACGQVCHGHCREKHARCPECLSILRTAPPPETWVEVLV